MFLIVQLITLSLNLASEKIVAYVIAKSHEFSVFHFQTTGKINYISYFT